ncbi:MAG: hemolysin family protein [Candidatus Bostrichicola ureolyticus]|nr:MAG: hemolysin family protein [Candidatus Bostrichicola ureolyticus]
MIFDYVCIIIMTMLMSAFFSGIEMAFISFNHLKIEIEKNKNNFKYKFLKKIIQEPKRFIATMLVGNNISLVIYGIYMGKLILLFISKKLYNEYYIVVLFLQTFFSTIIILITAEFLPKLIFNIYSYELLKILIRPIYFFYKMFYPIINFIMWISNNFLKLFGHEDKNEIRIFNKEDLNFLILENIENVKQEEIESEVKFVHRALFFSKKKAIECMIPRKEMITAEINSSIKEINLKFIKTGLSKLVIYKENVDNIIGYIHFFELFKKPKDILSIILPVEFVHITISAQDIMNFLIKKRKSLAIVLDEYGGTAGLITIEDIIEEIIGNIEDEHDKIKLIDKKIGVNKFIFSGRLEIDFINDKYKLNLTKSESYKTIGGLIMFYYGTIPKEGEILILNEFSIEIKKVSINRIEEVYIKIIK